MDILKETINKKVDITFERIIKEKDKTLSCDFCKNKIIKCFSCKHYHYCFYCDKRFCCNNSLVCGDKIRDCGFICDSNKCYLTNLDELFPCLVGICFKCNKRRKEKKCINCKLNFIQEYYFDNILLSELEDAINMKYKIDYDKRKDYFWEKVQTIKNKAYLYYNN